jgi:deoxyribodipyrimidine photo-lyase
MAETANKPQTIIVWFRNDLRVHDHPALASAADNATHIVPVFIFNEKLLHGSHSGSNRNRFLLESLEDLKRSLKKAGADLVVRAGKPETILPELITQSKATAVYYTADYSPYAISRDKRVKSALDGMVFRSFPGRLIVSAPDKLHTQAGTPHKVFTPFWKNWQQVQRRAIARRPDKLTLPSGIAIGELPKLRDMTQDDALSPDVLAGGETAGRIRLKAFLDDDIQNYHVHNNGMAHDVTSRLSAYFHFGCISAREVENILPGNSKGVAAWHRQLCWREFYHYILYYFPTNAKQEFQERYRGLSWGNDKKLLAAWQAGKTGYPVVDAGMRQLLQEGWMHNRARLIVGSFLTKDLWLDWRLGETHFMSYLIDGDEANNNGNWQWIASVGVDPAPVFRRLYNPTLQQKNYDPDGAYVRRYVPELAHVPDKYLAEPWTMPQDIQDTAHCIIGQDYPAPIVDHKTARLATLEHYRNAQ